MAPFFLRTRHVNRELRPGLTLILNPKGPNRALSQTDSTFVSDKSAEAGRANTAFEYVGRVSALRGLLLFSAGGGIKFVFISILWLHWPLCGSGVGSLSPLAGLVPPCFPAGSRVFSRKSDLGNVCAARSAVELVPLPV